MPINKWKKIFGSKSQYIKESPYNLMSYSLFVKVYSSATTYFNFLSIMKFISDKLKLKKKALY